MEKRVLHRVCKNCGAENQSGTTFCNSCGATLSEMKYCQHCGAQIDKACVICPRCGKQVSSLGAAPAAPPQQPVQQVVVNNTNTVYANPYAYGRLKNKWVAFFLCLFLGILGAHKFYEGKVGMGNSLPLHRRLVRNRCNYRSYFHFRQTEKLLHLKTAPELAFRGGILV